MIKSSQNAFVVAFTLIFTSGHLFEKVLEIKEMEEAKQKPDSLASH